MNIDNSADNSIDVKNLQFGYHRGDTLLSIAEWQVARRSQMFLYGPSGSGKSTLLNLLCGILTPQKGEIELLGQPFSGLSSRQRDQFRARHIGVVFQEFNLIPFLTVSENISLAAHFATNDGDKHSAVAERSKGIFARLQLAEELFTQRADRLSVGQRQRVSIARALINRPEILIADEPTSALDSNNRDEFMQLLLETAENSGCTVLFVSHDQGLQSHFNKALNLADLLDKI